MANTSKRKTPAAHPGVTASGLVEAVEQDFELSVEQLKDAAHDAVEAVEKKLGVRKAAKPKPKAAKSPGLKTPK
jgi:hypothetical protein